MIKLLFALLFVALLFAPQLWVRSVLKKYSKDSQQLPGSGGELAQHLRSKFQLQQLEIVASTAPDHYDPQHKRIALQQQNYDGKSLTAVAVAAHEFGHALQDARAEQLFLWRGRLVKLSQVLRQLAFAMIMAAPIIGWASPLAGASLFALGVLANASILLVHLVTIPVEFDASFKYALPLLRSGQYLPDADLGAVRRILLACALTYVASALTQVVVFWRQLKFGR